MDLLQENLRDGSEVLIMQDQSGLFPLSDNSGNKRYIKVEYQEVTDGGTLTAEWLPVSMGTITH